jgi:hypothetical protein
MNNFKMNLDRPPISKEKIESRQNFEEVLSKYKLAKMPVWKNPWFWGPAGLATVSLAVVLSINNDNNPNEINEKKTTLALANELPIDTDCIKPPIEEENIPFEKYNINPLKDEVITLKSGTIIGIPEGSLLPEQKDKPVSIEIREFPDKSSTFIAGIPMDFEENSAFESAGMIEIRGVQNKKIVEINSQKPIEISLKPTANPEGFGFWILDENQKSWKTYPSSIAQSQEKKSPEPNEIKKTIQQTQEKLETVEKSIINTREPKQSNFKIPTEGHQRFDLDFDKNDYPELAKFEKLVFEVIPTSGYDKSFIKKTWSEMKLDKNKTTYEMVFSSPKEIFKIAVRPILEGKELKNAEKEFDLAITDYHQKIEKLNQDKKELQLKKDLQEKKLSELLTSSTNDDFAKVFAVNNPPNQVNFRVNQWGVYNVDRPIKYPRRLSIEPVFTWISGAAAQFTTIFVFNLKKNTRYTYGGGLAVRSINDFGLHENDDLVIVGIDREQNFGYLEMKNRIKKEEIANFTFVKKEKNESALALLRKLMNENTLDI